MKFSEYEKIISNQLERYFTFFPNNTFNEKKYDIAAYFSTRQNQTVLFKENIMDFEDSKEVLLLSQEENLDVLNEKLSELPAIALKTAQPSRNHKSTTITRVFVTSKDIDASTIKIIKKFYFHKSFHCLLWGWTEVGVVLVSLADSKVYTNRTASIQKKIFTPVPIQE